MKPYPLIAILPLAILAAWPLRAENVAVEAQPLAGNLQRVMQTLDFLGAPLATDLQQRLDEAAGKRDARLLQQWMDDQTLAVITINPEGRVKAARGAVTLLQQYDYTQ